MLNAVIWGISRESGNFLKTNSVIKLSFRAKIRKFSFVAFSTKRIFSGYSAMDRQAEPHDYENNTMGFAGHFPLPKKVRSLAIYKNY